MNILAGLLLFLCLLVPGPSAANELTCDELRSAVGMVRASSLGALNKYRATAGKGYRSNVIYSFKYFDIARNDPRAAEKVFNALPGNDQQYAVWTTMGDSFCQSEKITDMKLMERFGARIPLLLSQAVIAHPEEMSRYIKYSLGAIQDPHNNLVFGMRHVCLVRHIEFKKAIGKLSSRDEKWFTNHVMQIDNCSPITMPESD